MPHTRGRIASYEAADQAQAATVHASGGRGRDRARRLSALGLLALLSLAPAAARAQSAPPTGVPANAPTPSVSPAGAGAQAVVDPFAALPPADALVTIDVARVFGEALPRLPAEEATLLASINDGLTRLKTLTGVEPRAVRRLSVGTRYAKPATGGSRTDSSAVMIAQSGEASQLPALIRQLGAGKYREEQYGGKRLYVELPTAAQKAAEAAAQPTTDHDVFAVTALDADTLVFGDSAQVRASIDAGAGKAARVSAELVTAATRNPQAIVSAAGLLPPGLLADIFPSQQAGDSELNRALAALKLFYAAVELTPAGVDLTISAMAASPDQARTLAHALDAVKTLVALAPAKTARDRLGRDVFKALVVSAQGDEVQARVALTQANVNLFAREVASSAYMDSGLAHKFKGEFDAAIADYDRALALEPDNALTYINRGVARSGKGDLDAAMADYDRAIALAPDNALAYNDRSFDKIKKGDFAGAVEDANRAIALDPRLAYAYNNRGYALEREGNLDAALADYERSLALDANNALAYNNRGYARYQLGDLERATADLDKAVQLDPDMVEARVNRGFARMDNGDTAGAIRDFEAALAFDPKAAEAYNGRGLVRYYKEDWAGAIRDFDQAIALNPKLAEVYGNRALARLASGHDAEAAQDFNTCFKLNAALRPNFEDLAREIKKTRRAKARPARIRKRN